MEKIGILKSNHWNGAEVHNFRFSTGTHLNAVKRRRANGLPVTH